jgi:hypothetical protein
MCHEPPTLHIRRRRYAQAMPEALTRIATTGWTLSAPTRLQRFAETTNDRIFSKPLVFGSIAIRDRAARCPRNRNRPAGLRRWGVREARGRRCRRQPRRVLPLRPRTPTTGITVTSASEEPDRLRIRPTTGTPDVLTAVLGPLWGCPSSRSETAPARR